jgi:Protein of unknown function (DUF1236)
MAREKPTLVTGKSGNLLELTPFTRSSRWRPTVGPKENLMKKLFMISATAAMLSTGALAQNTVVTTGVGHSAVRVEPETRTRIHSYVTEHKIRPVETREKIIVGSPLPRDVELEAVPAEWGPSLTRYRYVYSGQRVILVDPETRAVVDEIE